MRSILALVWGRRVCGRGSAVVGVRGRGVIVCVRWRRTIGDGHSRGYSTARCRLWWWARGKRLLALTVASRHLHVPYHLRDLATFGLVWFSLVGTHATITWRDEEIYLLWLSVPMSSHEVSDQKLFPNIMPGGMNLRWQRIGIVALVVGHGRLALTQL